MNDSDRKRQMADMRAWYEQRIKVLEADNAALVAERDSAINGQRIAWDDANKFLHELKHAETERDEAKNMCEDISIAMNCVGSEMDKVVQELNEARAWASAWKRAAKVKWIELCIQDDLLLFHQDTIKAMRAAQPGFVTPYPIPGTPTDEDERIARLETTVRGWQPGDCADTWNRGNVGIEDVKQGG